MISSGIEVLISIINVFPLFRKNWEKNRKNHKFVKLFVLMLIIHLK